MNRFFSFSFASQFSRSLFRTPLSHSISTVRPPLTSTVIIKQKRLTTCYTRGISEATNSTVSTDNEVDTKIPFTELGLKPTLVMSLNRLGYQTAFDIQAKTLPHTLNGRNVIGRAITGSGKTLAYALPIVHSLTSSSSSDQLGTPRGLVITPTRELCRQVTECISNLGMGLRCVALYGGDSYYRQERELHEGIDVVCATPGRLNDHVQRGTLRLDSMKFLVLDEADELLTPNFKEQIEHVLNTVPDSKQMMLFSATMPPDVKQLVERNMPDPVVVNLTSSNYMVPSSITHKVIRINSYNQFGIILDLLRVHSPERSIVFTRTKIEARELGSYLSRHGIMAASLHSDLSQGVRESCLAKFRSGRIKVIAATDVAARGIDIPEIDLVIQVEPPPSGVDFYIHRSGRTGRKGLPGTCILLMSPSRTSSEFLRDLRSIVKVEESSPPPREEVTKVCLSRAVKSIQKVKPNDLMSLALPLAEELYNEMGIDALASALVHISDARDPDRYNKRFEGRDRDYGGRDRDYGGRGRNYGGRDRDYGQFDGRRRENRYYGNYNRSNNSNHRSRPPRDWDID